MTPQILVVSRDVMLLQTRQLILGAFFRTQGAGRVREAEALMAVNSFDLVILCYTLTGEECRRLMELSEELRRRPRILMLTPAGTAPAEMGDVMMTEAGPYYLLKKSAEFLGVDIRDKASLVEV